MQLASIPSTGSAVLVLGGANMDIVAAAHGPLLPAESNPGRIRCAPGGVARNVAENLARLGRQVGLVTLLGDDAFGRQLLQATTAAGVDMRFSPLLAGRASSTYLSLHGLDGDMATAVNDMDLLADLTPAWLEAQGEPLANALDQAAAWVLDCNLAEPTLAWLLARAGHCPVFVDPVSAHKAARLRPWLARVSVLKANRYEAEVLSGQAVQDLAQARRAAQWLLDQGVSRVVLSLGDQGTLWLDAREGGGVLPVLRVPVHNTSGAGDALLAGLVFAQLAGAAAAPALRFANACAALTLGVAQANHPGLSVAAVRELLALQGDAGDAQSWP